ncbi:MAG: hypothetical protein KC731_18980, partial [Myxococcales bacterium]|nr:hypothetical protein [Myxococcales bacterium]
IVIVAATAITLLGLGNGLVLDDFFQRQIAVRGHDLFGRPHPVWDLFTFVPDDADVYQRGLAKGIWPWWMGPTLISFFRPIASLTHAADYLLWTESPWLMHLHSSLWYAATLTMAAIAYRGFFGPGLVLGVAVLLFAIDGNHGLVVGWLATRNMLIATTFALGALHAHRRARQGEGPRWSSPLLFALALCSAEFGLGALGYLVAFALFMDRGSWRERLVSIAPHLAIAVVWQVAYTMSGFGARGVGLYLHPADHPWSFVGAVVSRWPILVLTQLTVPVSEIWAFAPPRYEVAIAVVAGLAVLALGGYLFLPLIRRDPRARMLATGAALAVIPSCTTLPHSRLLLLVGFGIFGLFAMLVAEPIEQLWRRRLTALLVLRHTALAVVLLAISVVSPTSLGAMFDRAEGSLPTAQTLVVVNAPHAFLANFTPIFREMRDDFTLQRMRVLGTTMEAVTLTREDARTVRLEVEGGYLEGRFHHITYDPAHDRRDVGYRVDLGDMAAEVVAATEDHRPLAVRFQFDDDLSANGRTWVTWSRGRFEPFDLPAVGETVELPPLDFQMVLEGPAG